MSLILFMETDEGLILSGDSRLSSKIDPNWHEDTTEKVFKCNERVGIAYHGDADIKGEPIEKIIKDFICTVDKDDIIKQITEKLKEYVKTKGNPETKLYVLGYEKSERKIYRINTIDASIDDLSYSLHGSGGDDDIAWGMIQGNFDVHATNEKALEFITQIYTETMKFVDKVGGFIDILFIPFDKNPIWIQHK